MMISGIYDVFAKYYSCKLEVTCCEWSVEGGLITSSIVSKAPVFPRSDVAEWKV